MSYLTFPCNCRFKIVGDDSERDISVSHFDKLPRIDISTNPWDENSIHRLSVTCDLTWDMIGQGKTKGVFQLEKNLGQTWSRNTKPRSIEDLAALVALLRPGCLLAVSGNPPKSMTERYADRKMGREEVTFLHSAIADVLSTTYGVLTYQEQAMRIAEKVAAFNKQEADVLRKAIGKKKADIMAKVEKEFLEKAESAKIVTMDEAREIFGWIRESQKYSFNKSHAAAYGEVAYWSAYIKAHFPLTFYGAWILGANWKNSDKYEEIAELVNDAKLNNIDVRTPQFYSCTETTSIVDDEYIQFGLAELKDIGPSTVKKIQVLITEIETLLGKPRSEFTWLDILFYCLPEMGKKAATALLTVGAFDYLKQGTRRKLLFEYEQFSNVKDKELEWLKTFYPIHKWTNLIDALKAVQPVRKLQNKVWVGGGGTTNINRSKKLAGVIYLLENPPTSMEDTIEWIATSEEHYIGTPISTSKIDGCIEAIQANTTCREFLEGKSGHMIFALEIINVEETKTKKGKTPGAKMAKVKVRDSSCTLDAVIFPKEWTALQSIVFEGNTILVLGERTNTNGLMLKQGKEIH